MGFELFSRSHLLPQRMFVLLSTIASLGTPTRRDVVALLQPTAIVEDASTREQVDRLIAGAVRCGFVIESEDKDKRLSLAVADDCINTIESFRTLLQSRVLGIYTPTADHYVLNQIVAWYAVQNAEIIGMTKAQFEQKFNTQLYPAAEDRVLNENPGILTWIAWADFLGFGWLAPFGSANLVRLVPDATLRVRPRLDTILPATEREIPLGQCLLALARECPELDGGILFEQCWQASRGSEQRGNRLSLMLSTALRTLHRLGEIELSYRADALETWTLFPAQSHIVQVSHICRRAAA